MDVLIEDDSAMDVVMLLAELGELAKPMTKYLGLFRPESRGLSWSRTAKLLKELVPLVKQQRIERNRQVFEAPQQAWEIAIEQMLNLRNAGKLQLPLKSHGYLFEIIVGESAKAALQGVQIVAVDTGHKPQGQMSATLKALMDLSE